LNWEEVTMSIKTFGELIDWTRKLHEHLARCLAQGASQHKEERARMLLEYLAAHEAEMERVVGEFEHTASSKALKTYVPYLYAELEQRPIRTHRIGDVPYGSLSIDDIFREVFDFHDQVIDFYRQLSNEAQIPEAEELLGALLAFERHDAMRLARQTASINEF
jgi:hypothetical protein